MNNNEIMNILTGEKPVKVEIGINYMSISILAVSIFVVGFILIVIGKKA